MQIKRLIIPILLISMMIIMPSCSTSRYAASRYQTLSQRAQVTLQYDQQQYSMTSLVRVWKNELVVVSVQPMLGIEMLRMEATTDNIIIFDKMNRRYVSLTYPEIEATIGRKISYKTIQEFMSRQAKKDRDPLLLEFTYGEHHLKVSCKFSNRENNTLQSPTRTKTDKYKQVTLREILPIK